MPAPFYTTKEEKKAFLESCRDIYTALGYTKEQTDKIIKDKMKDDPESLKKEAERERRFVEANKYKKLLDAKVMLDSKKYPMFIGGNARIPEFDRVIRAMYKPENTLENIRYNEMLNKKLATKQGVVEIIEEAVTILGSADKRLFLKANPDNIASSLSETSLGFVAKSLNNVVSSLKNKGIITEEDLPTEVTEYMRTNKNYFEYINATESAIKRDASIWDMVIPENVTEDQMNKAIPLLYQKRSPEEVDELTILMPSRTVSKSVADPKKYTAPSNNIKEFFDMVHARMEEEKKDYVKATKRAESLGDTRDFVNATSAKEKKIITAINKDDPVRKANKELLDERQVKVDKRARDNYSKSLKDAADDIYRIVDNSSIVGHHNENYEAMLDSLKKIRKMIKDGIITEEQRLAFDRELVNLDNAAMAYIDKKYTDKKVFSTTALNRIDAAKMAAAFVRGRRADLVIEENAKLKEELDRTLVERGELEYASEYDRNGCLLYANSAQARFAKNRTPEEFAEAFTLQNAALTLGDMTISGGDLRDRIAANVEAYKELYNKSEDFRKLLQTGAYKDIVGVLPEIVGNMVKKEEPKVEEAPKPEVAPKVEEVKVEEEPKIEEEVKVEEVPKPEAAPMPEEEPKQEVEPEQVIPEENNLGIDLSPEELAAQIRELERIERERNDEPVNEVFEDPEDIEAIELEKAIIASAESAAMDKHERMSKERFEEYGKIINDEIKVLKDNIYHYNKVEDIAAFCFAKETLDKINLVGQVYDNKSCTMTEKLFNEYEDPQNKAINVGIISERPEFKSIVSQRSGKVDEDDSEEIYANYINNKSVKGIQDKMNANFELDSLFTYSHTVEYERLHTTLEAKCNLLNDKAVHNEGGNVDKNLFARYAAIRTAMGEMDSILGLRVKDESRVNKWNKFEETCNSKIDATTKLYEKDPLMDEIISEMGGNANFAKMYDSYIVKKAAEEKVVEEDVNDESFVLDDEDLVEDSVENEEVNKEEPKIEAIVPKRL